MEKKFNSREVAQMKRICQNVDGNYQKVLKLTSKVKELTEQMAELQAEIDEMEAPVVRKFGFKSTDLVEKVVTPLFNENGTPKTDKDGRQLKQTKFVLRYPETIVPPVVETVEETTDVQEITNGSDFDIDQPNI